MGNHFYHPQCCKSTGGGSSRSIETVTAPRPQVIHSSSSSSAQSNAASKEERDRIAEKINQGKHSCAGCKKVIGGFSMEWKGAFWHTECFKCSSCRNPLVDRTFAEGDDGLPICSDCRLGGAKCVSCLKPLEAGAFVTAGKHNYHPNCFNCASCRVNLRSKPYADVGGRILCGSCVNKH